MPRSSSLSGWVNLNKPAGISSNQALGLVKRQLNVKKAGFAGTLDPLASGVLPIALNQATRVISHITDSEKEYRFTLRWGISTDSDDAEGEVIATSTARPSATEITAILPSFTGIITQTPPVYSAIKQGGKRACDRARAGEVVEMTPREVTIHALSLEENTTSPDHATFTVTCAKGTYIRALARDMAAALGTAGHVSALTRTRVGCFTLTDALGPEQIGLDEQEKSAIGSGSLVVLPVSAALDDIPAMQITANQMQAIRHGQPVLLSPTERHKMGLYQAKYEDHLVALGHVVGERFKPEKVFHDNLT